MDEVHSKKEERIKDDTQVLVVGNDRELCHILRWKRQKEEQVCGRKSRVLLWLH